MKRKYEITSIDKIPIIKEKLEAKIQLKAQRIRKYGKQIKLSISKRHQKTLSRNRKRNNECKENPTIEEFKSSWRNI